MRVAGVGAVRVGDPVEGGVPGAPGPQLQEVPQVDQEGGGVGGQERDLVPGVLHPGLVTVTRSAVVPQKVASEFHPKVRNHGEGPY